ncbi:GNAT family N-acetyltransferase [Kribbella sp. NPDC004536]|uniref:GNAT family N-acetyltransferase n=1 Tax=Kribbella sp. NPDC004536 TaxID=3364106 RepID=UPI0036AF8158
MPVAVGGADYTKPPGAATIWQLSVQAELRSCGIGTVLIEALKQRIRGRGLDWAELGVDVNSARPQGLYERLGYEVSGSEPGGWNVEALDGTVNRYETQITLLRKKLT